MVAAGFALQLGLIGLIAADGGFDGVAGEPTHLNIGRSAAARASRALAGATSR
jgi:hypothetical protein